MKTTTVLLAASLFAVPLLAQEQVYIYVSYKDVKGTSYRHKLDCVDSKCKLNIKDEERSSSLSTVQKTELLDALQAEAKQFVVAADSASSDKLMKVKFRYDTPKKRLVIERRLPADQPADLTPGMLQVIKAHLDLDLSSPVLPTPTAGDEKSAEPDPQGQSK